MSGARASQGACPARGACEAHRTACRPADGTRSSFLQALSTAIQGAGGGGQANGVSAHQDVLQAAAPLVRAALAQGVYGRGPGRRPYEVATLP